MSEKILRPKSLQFLSLTIKDNFFQFVYKLDNQEIIFEFKQTIKSTLPQDQQLVIAKNIGMAYLVDIAEVVLPRRIVIDLPFSEDETVYWKRVFWEVARERIYIDKLDLSLLDIPWDLTSKVTGNDSFSLKNNSNSIILSVTGGKESLSAFQIFAGKLDILLLTLDPHTNTHRQKAIDEVSKNLPLTSIISNRRKLLNELEKSYQGRSASGVDMIHLTLNALLYGDKYRYVLLGNEYSANFPNTYYQGFPVNHQYVKTIEFAKQLNEYIYNFITPDFDYISPFFNLYEYRIAKYFFKHNKYLEYWTSCNNSTENKNFCEECPKCAFSYLLALAFRDKSFVEKYYKKDMLNEEFRLFRELMDFNSIKPLECVGEKKEVWVALEKINQQNKTANSTTLKYFKENILPIIKDDLVSVEREIMSLQKTYINPPGHIQTIITSAIKD